VLFLFCDTCVTGLFALLIFWLIPMMGLSIGNRDH